MLWRKVQLVTEATLVVAFFLAASQAFAGDRVYAGDRTSTRTQPSAAPVARPVTLSVASVSVVVVAPSQPAAEPVFVDLRGPDGQVRRFPVEGGRAVIQTRQVVLRPGESVTVHWTAAK